MQGGQSNSDWSETQRPTCMLTKEFWNEQDSVYSRKESNKFSIRYVENYPFYRVTDTD